MQNKSQAGLYPKRLSFWMRFTHMEGSAAQARSQLWQRMPRTGIVLHSSGELGRGQGFKCLKRWKASRHKISWSCMVFFGTSARKSLLRWNLFTVEGPEHAPPWRLWDEIGNRFWCSGPIKGRQELFNDLCSSDCIARIKKINIYNLVYITQTVDLRVMHSSGWYFSCGNV